MNNLKFGLMISIFSFANLIFAADMSELKKLVEDIDDLGLVKIQELKNKIAGLNDLVFTLNDEAFGPNSETLSEVSSNLTILANRLADIAKASNDDIFKTIPKLLDDLKDYKNTLNDETFLVPTRRDIRTQLLRLIQKFQMFANGIFARAQG